MPFAAALDGLLVSYSRTLRRTVEGAKSVHLTWHQLLSDRAHLLVDIVLAQPLGKSRKLALDIRGALAGQRRGTELEPVRGLANKLPEHAARLAAILALVDDLGAPEIG